MAKRRAHPGQTPNETLASLSLQDWESGLPTVGLCLRETLRMQLPGTMFRRNATGADVPIGSSGEYEYAWVLLTSSYGAQSFGTGTCGYGRHEITSDGPFEVTVWGTDYYASYGYPGGTGLRPISPIKPSTVN